MNYFAHGMDLAETPHLMVGSALPDMLSVVHRKARLRRRLAEEFLARAAPGPEADLAAGVIRHLDDDDWFHRTRAFNDLMWRFTVLVRDALPGDDGLRPRFLGHILVELLLDDTLIRRRPQRLNEYYDAFAAVEPGLVAAWVERVTGKPVERLAWFVDRFVEARVLEDYADDERLLYRLNQVMRRVRLGPLPNEFTEVFMEMRPAVDAHADRLMTPCAPFV